MSWTPTDEQVEKAARAIYEQTDWSGCAGSAWENVRDREDYFPLARAVLVAVGPHIAEAHWQEGYEATGGRAWHEREATNPYRQEASR